MVFLRDHHQPIIERSLWERTQRELELRRGSREEKGRYSRRYWCSGKLYCGVCGNRYVSRYKNLKSGTRYQAWRCYKAVNHGAPKRDKIGKWVGCKNQQINNQTLLFCMKFCVSHIDSDQAAVKKEILHEIRQLEKISGSRTGTRKIQREMEALNSKKRKAIDLALDIGGQAGNGGAQGGRDSLHFHFLSPNEVDGRPGRGAWTLRKPASLGTLPAGSQRGRRRTWT